MDRGRAEEVDVKVLRLFGMWCPSCAASCESRVGAVPGVRSAVVDFGASQLRVKYNRAQTNLEALQEAIGSLGFSSLDPLTLSQSDAPARTAVVRQYLTSLAVSAVLSMWITVLHVWVYLSSPADGARQIVLAASGILCACVIGVGGRPFIKAAWHTLRARLFSLDQVIVLGALSLFAYSWRELIGHRDGVYFDSLAMTITTLLLVRWTDFKLRTATSSPYWRFLNEPLDVTRVTAKGLVATTAQRLSKGKVIVAAAGCTLPLDGVVVKGELWLDESLLSGESLPCHRGVGQQVLAGARVVRGEGHVEVTHPVGDRYLDRVFLASEASLTQRGRTRGLLETIYGYWIPALFAIAVILALSAALRPGYDPLRSFALTLLIGCPCIFVVGTTALRLVLSRATEAAGIRLRHFDFFYDVAAIDYLVFDKTGTLTSPLAIKDELLAPACTPELKAIAYEVLALVHHPVSALFAEPAGARSPVVVTRTVTSPGEGTEVYTERHGVFRIGRASFAGFGDSGGGQRFHVSHDGVPLFSLDYDEVVSAETEEMLRALRGRGYTLVLASGDTRLPAALEELRGLFAEVHVGCRPADKQRIVEGLKTRGSVCFIGDGLNDALALAEADLSIAVASRHGGVSPAASVGMPGRELPRLLAWMDRFERFTAIERWVLAVGVCYNVVLLAANAWSGLHPLVVLSSFAAISILSLGPIALSERDSASPRRPPSLPRVTRCGSAARQGTLAWLLGHPVRRSSRS